MSEVEQWAKHVTNNLEKDGMEAYRKLHGKERALVEGKF